MKLRFCIVFFVLTFATIFSFEKPADTQNTQPLQKKEELKEENSETHHSVTINGVPINYTANAGTLLLKDDQGNVKASIFYISYLKNMKETDRKRPITFCFNGGPGASSVWLQLGALGPRRVDFANDGNTTPPYHLIDNEFSLLDTTDLVFIDPVSTGYSRAPTTEEAKQYHGVEEDIKSIAEFIRIFTTRNDRWESPKFLAGESYGTTRAAGLSSYLNDQYNMNLNGIILVSSVLNFITINTSQGNNDLPYILFLPSFTAAAWYHKKLSPELQNDFLGALKQSEEFARGDYAVALMKGDTISKEEKQKTVIKMARLIGLSERYVDLNDMRVSIFRFAQELLRDERKCIGRFDSRKTGIENDPYAVRMTNDPSFENLLGLFTATFNHYVREDLKWHKDNEYRVLAEVNPWNYGNSATNQYLNVADNLKDMMTRYPKFNVFVASGYFDLATPYYATNYTFSHLGIAPVLRSNVTMKYYQGGHMMFLTLPALQQLKGDLASFFSNTLGEQKQR